MTTDNVDQIIAIQNLDKQIDEAYGDFYRWIERGDDWSNPCWSIESCFIQLLAIAECLGLVPCAISYFVLTWYNHGKSSRRFYHEATLSGNLDCDRAQGN